VLKKASVYGLQNDKKRFSNITIHIKTPLAVDNTAKGVLSSLFIGFELVFERFD